MLKYWNRIRVPGTTMLVWKTGVPAGTVSVRPGISECRMP